MVKVLALIPQRPEVSREEFHSHWLHPHGTMACDIDTLQAYVQCHRLRPGLPGLPLAEYEGIAEVWFTDVETAAAMGEHPVYAGQVQPDEANFIDLERLAFVFTDENVVRDGAEIAKDTPTVKAQLLLRRAAGTSREDFDAAWATIDEGFESSFPKAIRLVRTQVRPESYAEGEPAADGFAEIWWPDRETFEADWTADGEPYLRSLEAFADLDASSAFLSTETRLLWP